MAAFYEWSRVRINVNKWEKTFKLKQHFYYRDYYLEKYAKWEIVLKREYENRGNRCKIGTVNKAQINCIFEQGLKPIYNFGVRSIPDTIDMRKRDCFTPIAAFLL